MRTTVHRAPRRALRRAVAATVAAVAVLAVTTPAAVAQEPPSATISSACDGDRFGVITVVISGSEDDGFLAMIGGAVLGPVRPGTNEYPYQRDGTSEVSVLLTYDGSTTELVAAATVTIDCVAEPTATAPVPASPTTTVAPAPTVANRSAARQVSFTG